MFYTLKCSICITSIIKKLEYCVITVQTRYPANTTKGALTNKVSISFARPMEYHNLALHPRLIKLSVESVLLSGEANIIKTSERERLCVETSGTGRECFPWCLVAFDGSVQTGGWAAHMGDMRQKHNTIPRLID